MANLNTYVQTQQINPEGKSQKSAEGNSILTGFNDSPIFEQTSDKLDMTAYAEALSKFVLNCNMPMTISLQGDWGTGKTSLMNLIVENIKQQNENLEHSPKIIWFNTWRYSQFNLSESLAVSFISQFCKDISGQVEGTNILWLLRRISGFITSNTKRVLDVIGAVTSNFYGKSSLYKDVRTAALKGLESVDDPAGDINLLKNEIKKVINSNLTDGQRVIVFLDDLDRLLPIRAVELLECLKVFFELDRCVFVVACDYKIILQGLETKFSDKRKAIRQGRSFFDKIIQLPFNMPVSQYNIHKYFDHLIDSLPLGVKFSENSINDCIWLLDKSVGVNPRALKRILNSLFLLTEVGKHKYQDYGDKATFETNYSEQDLVIMFGVLCMQISFESLYLFLATAESKEITDELFNILRDPKKVTEKSSFKQLRRDLGLKSEDNILSLRLERFLDRFYSVIQLAVNPDDSDDELSEEEVYNLQRIIASTISVVNTNTIQSPNSNLSQDEDDYVERRNNRAMAKDLAEDLTERYRDIIDRLPTENGEFTVHQKRSRKEKNRLDPTVRISLNIYRKSKINIGFRAVFRDEQFHFSIRNSNKRRSEQLLNWAQNTFIHEHFPNITFSPHDQHNFVTFDKVDARELDWETSSELFKEKAIQIFDKVFEVLDPNSFDELV